MADYRNCSHHVFVKTGVSSLGALYALAKSQQFGEWWVETHPDGLTFHFARFGAAFFFATQCIGRKGLEAKLSLSAK